MPGQRFRFGGIFLVFVSLLTASRAAAPEQAVPPLHVAITRLGGPLPVHPTRVGAAVLNGKRVPMYLQPWGQEFPVLLRVTNCSAVPQSFTAYGCSWIDNWQARVVRRHRREEVSVGEPGNCAWNPLQTLTLKPGESYQKQTIVSIRARGRGRVRIQIGFACSPDASSLVSRSGHIFWSSALVVPVTKAYGAEYT